ncbi:MAG: hypothetical protein ACPG61_07305, partial [Paracoccaceae bacterium]
MRILAYTLAALLVLTTPADAAPIGAAITAFSTFLASGTVAAAVVRIGLGFALSALASVFAKKPEQGGGVKTESTTSGGTTSQSFILGRYFTAGNLTAPLMAHKEVKTRGPTIIGYRPGGGEGEPIPIYETLTSYSSGSGNYRTIVVDFSDMPIDEVESVFIDNHRFDWTWAGTLHPTYGRTVLNDEYKDRMWAKIYYGNQTTADASLLTLYGDHPERPWH